MIIAGKDSVIDSNIVNNENLASNGMNIWVYGTNSESFNVYIL